MGEQVTYSQSEAVEDNSSGSHLLYFEKAAFDAVLEHPAISTERRTELFAQLARFNTLYMIARAGSGHIGSSFSSLDIVCHLYLNVLNGEDRYYSSKGHDAPGLYSALTALGILPFDNIHKLRRLDGLPGHPDVAVAGMVTNTGSLGMGISKAKGFILADDLLQLGKGRIFVLTGDGELQEGQFWESLFSAGRLRNDRLTVIVDHNKIQSDTFVEKVNDLGDLVAKFDAFGFETRRINGHAYEALQNELAKPTSDGRPLAIIADTIKGRGVAFMEHTSMSAGEEFYRYHSGAPAPAEYSNAIAELLEDIEAKCTNAGISLPKPKIADIDPIQPPANAERMIPAYTEALLALADAHPALVALDADLILDTGLIPFKERFPERFFECGIAEQDMVSQAGTMALGGLLPVVHSFSCFLTTRPTEQIYNNYSERSKIVYVGSLSGLLPAGPGHSHQSVRDFATMSGMPGFAVIEPLTAAQIAPILDWCVNLHDGSSYVRLTSIPYQRHEGLDELDQLRPGCGSVVREGGDLIFVVTNPVLLGETLKAAELLAEMGYAAKVIGTPWINLTDVNWYREQICSNAPLVTVENHYSEHGFGSQFLASLAEGGVSMPSRVRRIGLRTLPASGRNDEVLKYHGLDAHSLATRAQALL